MQWVPAPIVEVFEFFSNEHNLETITPPWLNFRVEKKSTPVLQQGTLIDYKLRIHLVPARWQSRIEAWQPPELFADRQMKGPYNHWYHLHRFYPDKGGTRIEDQVFYQLPLGRLGQWIAGAWIRRDLKRIFEYRYHQIEARFGK